MPRLLSLPVHGDLASIIALLDVAPSTVRYTNRQVTLELEDAERVAKQMGIGAPREEKQAASGGNGGK